MDKTGSRENGRILVKVGTLELKGVRDSWYCGIAVTEDIILIGDYETSSVRVHRRRDGELLATHELESLPYSICVLNGMEICVILFNGHIVILSVQCTGDGGTITLAKKIIIKEEWDVYQGVSKFKDDLVVCGVKRGTVCWCIVSLNDGSTLGTIHYTCKGDYIDLTAQHNMIYISSNSGHVCVPDNGVYGYDMQTPSQEPYIYKHRDLYCPTAITVDHKGFVFVCNYGNPDSDHPYPCIHHLTEKCELLSIFNQEIPPMLEAIFWDQHQGHLHVAARNSNVITTYTIEYQDPILPVEILRMDDESIKLYKRALQDGKEKVHNIRVMVVGQYGVGKTTLTKRLLGQKVNIAEWKSTEGIDVHKHCCKIYLSTWEWIVQNDDSEKLFRLQRLMNILPEPHLNPYVRQEEEDPREDIRQINTSFELDVTYNNDTASNPGSDQKHQLTSFQPSTLSFPLNKVEFRENQKANDAVVEIIKLINKNSDKLEKNAEKYASLSVWDFAGQYAFYTTHQTFLTRRALYLLVIDLSQQITDPIKDDKCFLDMEGIKPCKVHDLVEIWMNSIHSCASSPEASIPHVILVGTHVDKLSEKYRKEIVDKYFKDLRYILKDKPTIRHLMDDIAIDNTQIDPMLEILKRKIVELASQQPHWGEERPARWLPLEQAIMTLQDSGAKVVARSLIEEINMSGSVKIEDSDELDLFLIFHHEMGTILYFSVEGLREKIVLDPQWLIDALKTLITAEVFIRKYPAFTSRWYEFKETGKITDELIDAIWTENNHEFRDNKDHILLLMEKLNIIARPRSFTEDGNIKESNYFLAPCMLQQKAPAEVICPKSKDQMGSSSVLCFEFIGKFMPSPIFHRLLAACVAHWPIATKIKEEKKENQIFCGCCVFQLDSLHSLTLHFKEFVIFVRVTKMGIKDKTPSSKLCIEAREFINTNLLKIIGYLGQSLKFEYFIQCPEYNGESVNSLIPLSELKENAEVRCKFHNNVLESCNLLKFWFEDKEQAVDVAASSAVPMPPGGGDTDRFMRLTYLLVDVGSRILRQLLSHHTVTPTCTLDQYFAKHRNTINSLLKRKVLHQSQMDILFPPNGGNTNLEDYDVTLLSALFNNIVPSLTQQEESMIKSLREDRNKLYGHAKSCKMNATEYQTCWNSISSTLITLSQQCGDPSFQNEISQEIQRIQVSAIPTGSYLDILKTWFSTIETVKGSLEGEIQALKSRLEALELKKTAADCDGK